MAGDSEPAELRFPRALRDREPLGDDARASTRAGLLICSGASAGRPDCNQSPIAVQSSSVDFRWLFLECREGARARRGLAPTFLHCLTVVAGVASRRWRAQDRRGCCRLAGRWVRRRRAFAIRWWVATRSKRIGGSTLVLPALRRPRASFCESSRVRWC